MTTAAPDRPACRACGCEMAGVESPSLCPQCGAAYEPLVPDEPPCADARAAVHPLMEMLRIAGPTVMTMTSFTLMQAVDKLMVSRIGPDPVYVGAQGNGGLAAFVPIGMVMGVLTVINTYVSQNLGARRPERGPAYAWNGLWIAVLAWIPLLIYGVFLPDLFAFIGHEGRRLELESVYGRILVFGSVLTMSTRGISQYFYGMHRPMVVLAAGLVGNLTNFGCNYLLIYGSFGFPALGVMGAAVGTVIGTAVEFAIPMAVFLSPAVNRRYRTRAAWRPSPAHLKDLLRIGWPGGLMFGNEMICWGIFMVYLVGMFGPEHSTAGWIAHQWMALSFMPAVGISVATTAIVGRCMGMRRPDLAARRAWLGVGLTVAYMGACGAAFIAFRAPMIRLFIDADTPPETAARLVALGSSFLIATAAFQLFDAVAITLCGALRGAGDTVWVGIATVVLSWGLIVGGGHLMVARFPEFSSLGPWIAAAAYIAALSVAILWRFLSGQWRTIRLVQDAPPTP